MSAVIIGNFMGAKVEKKPRKDGTGDVLLGNALVEIENSYQKQGETVSKIVVFPFKVFGKTAEVAEGIPFGSKVKVTYELEAHEHQGKYYQDVKAIFVNKMDETAAAPPKQRDGDVPF